MEDKNTSEFRIWYPYKLYKEHILVKKFYFISHGRKNKGKIVSYYPFGEYNSIIITEYCNFCDLIFPTFFHTKNYFIIHFWILTYF